MGDNTIQYLIEDNRDNIEKIQIALTNTIALKIYLSYLSSFHANDGPVKTIFIPTTKEVRNYLCPSNYSAHLWMNIKDNLWDYVKYHPMFIKLRRKKEFDFFNNEDNDNEIFKYLITYHIIPNCMVSIPDVLRKKFSLDDDSVQTFHESDTIDEYFVNELKKIEEDYLYEEFILKYIHAHKLYRKKVIAYNEIGLYRNDSHKYISLDSNHNIVPILIDEALCDMKEFMSQISFVTNTDYKTEITNYDSLLYKFDIPESIKVTNYYI